MQNDPATAPTDPVGSRPVQRWAMVRRWVMVAVALVLAGAVPVLASFESNEGALLDGLRNGSVSEVAVGEQHIGPGGGRDRSVRVVWRGRLLQRHAEVSVGKDASSATPTREEHLDEWQDLQPDLVVSEGPSGHTGGSFGPAAKGVEVPSWMAIAWLVTLLGTVVRLVTGPQPHVFRKWGWFWLVWFVPVIGALNFWLTGDRPGSPAPVVPGESDRRFGGASGFLASVGLSAALVLILFVL